jgi:signal transduction histidine kinase
MSAILSIEIRYEQDVVLTRQRARQIASLVGFSNHEQTALATAVSEVARNAFRYAGGGRVEFTVDLEEQPQSLRVRVQDKGQGIPNLPEILDGRYVSQTGMGLGIIGSKRLSDEFAIESTPGKGTHVVIGKRLPKRTAPLTPQALAALSSDLAQRTPKNPLEEIQEQNKELLQALEDLRVRQSEVERLNGELAETNRGVVALYAELDEKAESLRKASEYKSRFLSDMTHELRTPLNAMISLSRLLLDRVDGDLSAEQERQVSLIHKSATSLGEMVNDLLDLAKIEAGKTEVRVTEFAVSDVLSALRGMFRPLLGDGRVRLHVGEPVGLGVMSSDERKVSQILRNLVSNAVKFTEHGEIAVRAEAGPDDTAVFTVADTGIGVDPGHLSAIFEDYTQIDSGVQRRVTGTGLGLPLTRKLARLLGGDVTVVSESNVGSTFTVTLPRAITEGEPNQPSEAATDDAAATAQGGRRG